MNITTASNWAVDLLTGSITDAESTRDPPTLRDPILWTRARAFRTAFPTLSIAIQHLTVEGDWVAVHATRRGQQRALFQGCPATGRSWRAGCTAMFQVAHNQIDHGWTTWDLLAILEQLGAVERSDTVSA